LIRSTHDNLEPLVDLRFVSNQTDSRAVKGFFSSLLGSVFGIFAGFYYWIGKMSGHQYPESLGKMHFWLTFVGVNLTFFPQHFLGLAGMPRRYPDYPDAFAGWNFVSSIGAYIAGAGLLVFLFVLVRTFTSKEPVPNNYWGEGATSLEWTVSSPPPSHTFLELPMVR
jgi:cytochrome c oxidase subunit I